MFRDDSGAIDQINAGFGNTGKRSVEGLDIVSVYELPTTNFGKWTWKLGYNHFFRWKADTGAGVGSTNFLGKNLPSLPLAPGAIPYNKGFFRTEWEFRNVVASATINYIGDYQNDGSFINGAVPGGGFTANTQTNTSASNPTYLFNRKTREYITLDLQASCEFKKPKPAEAGYSKDSKGVRTEVASNAVSGNFLQKLLRGTKIKVGVNNVFDTPPPFDAGAFNDNYDTSTYSIRNRFYYIGLNKKF